MNAVKVKLNQQVEVCINSSRSKSKTFKGEVVSVTDYFITIKNNMGIRESFKYIDFLTGELELMMLRA